MKHLKYFESKRQFREVDLQEIWDSVQINHSVLFDNPVITEAWFYNRILNPLLLDKYIEFRKVIHPYDKEVSYAFSGKVKGIRLMDTNRFKNIVVSLYPDSNRFLDRPKDLNYIIGTIDDSVLYNKKYVKSPLIVKIYDSEPLEIESKLDILNIKSKYNI